MLWIGKCAPQVIVSVIKCGKKGHLKKVCKSGNKEEGMVSSVVVRTTSSFLDPCVSVVVKAEVSGVSRVISAVADTGA